MESIFGRMVENTKESGYVIKCMERVNIHGGMAENMMEITCTIRNMDLVHILGRMEGDILENGKTVSVTAKGRSYLWTVVKERVYGPKTKECGG